MAKRVHDMMSLLPQRMRDELHELIINGNGHDWARTVLACSDAMLGKDDRIAELDAARKAWKADAAKQTERAVKAETALDALMEKLKNSKASGDV